MFKLCSKYFNILIITFIADSLAVMTHETPRCHDP